MKELSIQDIKQSGLDILNFLHEVCEKNNLTYYLAYGTAIGAMRHQGFIPWDDDIDIFMFREDFNKLRQIFKDSQNKRFALKYVIDDPEYTLPYPKVVDRRTSLIPHDEKYYSDMGVYVDIFLLDNVIEDDNERIKFLRKLDLYKKMWSFLQYKSWIKGAPLANNILRCVFFPFSFINPRFFAKKIDQLADSANNTHSARCGNLLHGAYGYTKETFLKDYFNGTQKCTFEGNEYYVPIKCDEYLRHVYGDYMQLPPVEKRVTHHNFTAYSR